MKRLIGILLAMNAIASCEDQACLRCADTTSCDVCNTFLHYVSDGRGRCSVRLVERCTLMDDAGLCHACSDGFTPVLGACKKSSAPPCAQFNCEGVCVDCAEDEFLDGNDQCAALPFPYRIPGCIAYRGPLDSLVCQRCGPGFYVSDNFCLPELERCLVPTEYGCDECERGGFPVPADFDDWDQFWAGYIRDTKGDLFGLGRVRCVFNTDPNCERPASPTACARCRAGFAVNANGVCQRPSPLINQCQIYASLTECAECISGFYLLNGVCTQVQATLISNCDFFSSPNVCARCAAGFFLQNGACVRVTITIGFCEVYASNSACLYCRTGYYPQGGACVAATTLIDNCLVYSATGCLVCRENFYLDGAACRSVPNLIAFCTRYQNAVTCSECLRPYFLQGNQCVGSRVSSCRIYNQSRQCLYCEPQFYLSQGSCLAVSRTIAACDIYSGPTSCFRCQANFNLVNGACQPGATRNCSVYSGPEQCQFCNAPYYYDNATNACVGATVNITDCFRYADARTCVRCSGSTYLINNQCLPLNVPADIIDECLSYDSSKNCQVCKQGRYLSADRRQCLSAILIQNCNVFTSETTCSECLSLFYLSGNQCLPRAQVDFGCETYTNGACAKCFANRFLNQNGICASSTVIANCYQYSAFGLCALCERNFVISANTCVALNAVTVNNCLVFRGDGVCQFCETGFYLTGNQCLQAINVPNCARYAGSSTCAECSPGFYLAAGRCEPISAVTFCKYLARPGLCAICQTGYYLLNGVCTQVMTSITGCLEYAGPRQCAICSSGLYPQGSACVALPSGTGIGNCAVYSGPATCSRCIDGYYLYQNACYTGNVDNCLVFAGPQRCASCALGFALSANGQCIANCYMADLTCSKCSVCEICAEGYYRDFTRTCVRVPNPIPNCRYYFTDKRCRRCQTDFVLRPDGTCEETTTEDCAFVTRETKICALCEAGYYFGPQGACTPVPATIEGCWHYEQRDPRQCAVCQIDYYHDSASGLCVPVPPILIESSACHVDKWLAPSSSPRTWMFAPSFTNRRMP